MAIIGFIVIVLLALVLLISTFVGWLMCAAFSGKGDPTLWIPFLLSCGLFYVAYVYAPFHVVIN